MDDPSYLDLLGGVSFADAVATAAFDPELLVQNDDLYGWWQRRTTSSHHTDSSIQMRSRTVKIQHWGNGDALIYSKGKVPFRCPSRAPNGGLSPQDGATGGSSIGLDISCFNSRSGNGLFRSHG